MGKYKQDFNSGPSTDNDRLSSDLNGKGNDEKDPEKALEYYDKAIKIADKNWVKASAYYNKGSVLLWKLNRYEEALFCFKEAYELNNSFFSVATAEIGKCYFELKKYDEALEYYNKKDCSKDDWVLKDIEFIKNLNN